MSQTAIEKKFNLIYKSLAEINGPLGYSGIIEALIELCDLIEEYDGETESIWSIGEFGAFTLDSLIVGAYWHFTEWHNGQYSQSYACLCALGSIFQPNMSSLDEEAPEYEVYELLKGMAA